MRTLTVLMLTVLVATTGFSTVIVSNQVGVYNNWATDWISLGGYDPDDGVDASLDFVGDANNPGLYYANNGAYIFFRMRVDADVFSKSGANILLIDVAGYGVTGIDYAFTWDSKGKIVDHGLEMSLAGQNGPTWGVSQVSDIDGEPSAKTTLDINGNGRTTDGYVRTTDGQSGGVFGLTTFIDFAVSWNYLEIYTNLRSNQTWTVGLASIANATDHNVFNADVSGATLTNDIDVGWSAPVAVPEPASALMIGLGAGLIFLVRRICNRN